MPDGVTQTDRMGRSSMSCRSAAVEKPPKAEFVPRSTSISAQNLSPDRRNAAKSVRTELKTFVSCWIWAAAIR
jgi:hypothetical protein